MSWNEVQQLDLPAAFELMNYWSKYPTPSMILRAYFKIEPPKGTWHEISEQEALKQFNALHATWAPYDQAAANVTRIPEHMREAIEWAEGKKLEMATRKKIN